MRFRVNFLFCVLVACSPLVYPQSWRAIGPPGGRVNALAINPQNSSVVYAGTRDGSIFRSTDRGESSELISDDILNLFVGQIAINPQNPNIIYTSDYRSTDGGTTWSQMNGGGAQYAINPLNPEVIFVTRFTNEIWISRNAGDSWARLSTLMNSYGRVRHFSSRHKYSLPCGRWRCL